MNEVLNHYKEIMLDPAHLMAEISLMVLVDVLFLGLIWPLVRRAIRREHLTIDTEHGVINHGASTREAEIASLVRRATLDPGSFVKRGPDYDGNAYGERLDQWQDRAIQAALRPQRLGVEKRSTV